MKGVITLLYLETSFIYTFDCKFLYLLFTAYLEWKPPNITYEIKLQ